MRKQQPEKPTVTKQPTKPTQAKADLWGLVLQAMPKELGFSVEPLPAGPDTLRFRVNGPTTVIHRTGHFDVEVLVAKAKQPWLDALKAGLVKWAEEDRP